MTGSFLGIRIIFQAAPLFPPLHLCVCRTQRFQSSKCRSNVYGWQVFPFHWLERPWNHWSLESVFSKGFPQKSAHKTADLCKKPNKTNSFFNCFPQQWKGCQIQILIGFAPYPIDACTLVKKEKKKKTKKKKKKGYSKIFRANLVKSFRLEWKVLHLGFRWFTTPVVCYGWSLRLPTFHTAD